MGELILMVRYFRLFVQCMGHFLYDDATSLNLFSFSQLLGEQLPGGIWGYVGAGMITFAAATNALLDLSPGSADDDLSTETTSERINGHATATCSSLVANDDASSNI
jgi:hypothetical protein